MAELIDVMSYLCKYYPNKNELSNGRLTKLVYLADWKSCIDKAKQLTEISWRFSHFGPFVYDIKDTAIENPDVFNIIETTNAFDTPMILIHLKDKENISYQTLNEGEKAILDLVINVTKDKSWDGFIKFVYSTYPIVSQEKYLILDLPALATEYKEKKELFYE